MSFVNTVIVTVSHLEVNSFLKQWNDTHEQHFKNVSSNSGGSKYPEIAVLLAAFNYVDTDVVIEFIKKATWNYPWCMAVFSQDEDEGRMEQKWP